MLLCSLHRIKTQVTHESTTRQSRARNTICIGRILALAFPSRKPRFHHWFLLCRWQHSPSVNKNDACFFTKIFGNASHCRCSNRSETQNPRKKRYPTITRANSTICCTTPIWSRTIVGLQFPIASQNHCTSRPTPGWRSSFGLHQRLEHDGRISIKTPACWFVALCCKPRDNFFSAAARIHNK